MPSHEIILDNGARLVVDDGPEALRLVFDGGPDKLNCNLSQLDVARLVVMLEGVAAMRWPLPPST